ncbi:blastula protease 10 [Patella vulgata]|uniref:blastula protease 10 n=1 Tax=Patella vulgata TaxID=6465 RepID=UPI00218070D1|nr:blastula protease 10 [Patella vulgata]
MAQYIVFVFISFLFYKVPGIPLQISVNKPNSEDPLAVLQRQSAKGLPKPDEEFNDRNDTQEFDMRLTPNQKRYIEFETLTHGAPRHLWKRKAIADYRRYWPYGIVPYTLDPTLSSYHRQWVTDAMYVWERDTCVEFRYSTPPLSAQLGHTDSVFISHGEDCITSVGKVPGGQNITIGRCRKGSIIHELGHTLGFVHEQSRPDRDGNVEIVFNNIIPSRTHDFDKYPDGTITTYGEPYDFGSIMHYSSTAYTKNGHITVKTHDPHIQMTIGQRDAPSFLDLRLINDIYDCNAHCEPRQCNNEGYQGPSCECICPEGFIGEACNELETSHTGCGGTILSDSRGTITSSWYPGEYPITENCYWLIKGPIGSTISINVEAFDTDNAGDCQWCNCDYLELKVYGFEKVGQRYCGKHVDSPYRYNWHQLLVHFRTDELWTGNSGFKLHYIINQ